MHTTGLAKFRGTIASFLTLMLACNAHTRALRDISIGLNSTSLGTAGLRVLKELGIAAVGKLYPDLDASSLDLLFASESLGWKARPQIETIDPAAPTSDPLGSAQRIATADAVDHQRNALLVRHEFQAELT